MEVLISEQSTWRRLMSLLICILICILVSQRKFPYIYESTLLNFNPKSSNLFDDMHDGLERKQSNQKYSFNRHKKPKQFTWVFQS